MNKLQHALEEEKRRTSDLTDELNLARINEEYHKLIEADFKQEIEKLSSEKANADLEYNKLNDAKDEKIRELEMHIAFLTTQLNEISEKKKSKRRKSTHNIAKDGQSGPEVLWLEEWGSSILAV